MARPEFLRRERSDRRGHAASLACPLARVTARRPWSARRSRRRGPRHRRHRRLRAGGHDGGVRGPLRRRDTADGRQPAECRRVGHPSRCSGGRPRAAPVRAGAAGPRAGTDLHGALLSLACLVWAAEWLYSSRRRTRRTVRALPGT
ncbi:MAG: hypothetical protein MZW92_53240 [Comamonadaceae bacterium]|nr:hypothetical protein [Comamonadaceae bacterium]